MTAAAISRAEQTRHTVEAFLDAHRRRDVTAMAELCSYGAEFNYPGYELVGKQRVIHGAGKVHTIGKPIWNGMAHSFPDLSNQVVSISANDAGWATAEVIVTGTQAETWFTLSNRGGAFSLPHHLCIANSATPQWTDPKETEPHHDDTQA
jgi:hypothetical protein